MDFFYNVVYRVLCVIRSRYRRIMEREILQYLGHHGTGCAYCIPTSDSSRWDHIWSFCSVVFGMEALLWGIVFNSIIVYLLNSTYSVDLIHYPVKKQLLDILPTILCFSVISAFSMIVGSLLGSNIFTSFIVKTLAFCVIVIAVGEIFHVSEYKECKKVLRDSVC